MRVTQAPPLAPGYTQPVPGGTIGRTDQGVDISAPPGTPVYAIAKERLVGIIQNWYNGQPYYWFQQVGTNIYNYVAEQFVSGLKPGDTVQQGQEIGQVAQSGTGLELGFATPSGQTLARASGPVTEGQPTAAGQAYSQEVLQRGTNSPSLAQLWIQAGGNPALANTMAAIAMAESGGDVSAQNPSGAAGLWQILPSAHPQYNVDRLLNDPMYNAQAAVAVEKSQGLSAWATYTSGAYKSYLPTAGTSIPSWSRSRPGGESPGNPTGSGGSVQQELKNYVSLRDTPRTAPPGTKNPFKWWQASFTGNWGNI